MYIYLVVSILQVWAICQAILSQCPKLWLLEHGYRVYTEYGLQKFKNRLLLKNEY